MTFPRLHSYFQCSCPNWCVKIVPHNWIPIRTAIKCPCIIYVRPFKTCYWVLYSKACNPFVLVRCSLRFYSKKYFRYRYIYSNPLICICIQSAPTALSVKTYIKWISLEFVNRWCWNWKSLSYSCNYHRRFRILQLFVVCKDLNFRRYENQQFFLFCSLHGILKFNIIFNYNFFLIGVLIDDI